MKCATWFEKMCTKNEITEFSFRKKFGQNGSKLICRNLYLIFLFLAVPQMYAQHGDTIKDKAPAHALLFIPDDIEWKKGPPSFEEGAEFSILEGDPSQPGVFTLRLRMPNNFKISPHWHPNVERVTVISGNFHLGHGDEFDDTNTENYGPGSYISLPPKMTHFALAKGETELQLTSIGPWKIHYVKEEDDPRLRKNDPNRDK